MVNPTLARLAGRPLAMAPRALDGLLASAAAPELRTSVRSLFDATDRAAPGYALTDGGIAVVPVLGPLVTRGDWLTAFLGAMSYDEVAGAIAAAFPLGTLDTFVTYGAPANLIETVNTMGLPIYARQIARPDGSAIEVKTEASILPVKKRPRLAVRIHSSN